MGVSPRDLEKIGTRSRVQSPNRDEVTRDYFLILLFEMSDSQNKIVYSNGREVKTVYLIVEFLEIRRFLYPSLWRRIQQDPTFQVVTSSPSQKFYLRFQKFFPLSLRWYGGETKGLKDWTDNVSGSFDLIPLVTHTSFKWYGSNEMVQVLKSFCLVSVLKIISLK